MPRLDHPDLKADRETFEKHLADLGPAAVRSMMALGQFPTTSTIVVLDWLKGAEAPKGGK
jgi:hypothetical protein